MQVDGITGRTAVVTGAARGIGHQIADLLAENGARVAVLDLQPASSSLVSHYECDVGDPRSVDAAFTGVEEDHGAPSIVVLNAGIFLVREFEETSDEIWRRTLDVNLTGAFLCARRALPAMRKAGYGRLLTVSSAAGKTGGTGSVSAYAASKGGLLALTKAIALEYAANGVTANALAPAFIETDMIRERSTQARAVPVGRLGDPREVAELALWLCSTGAGFTTGGVFNVNGGLLMD